MNGCATCRYEARKAIRRTVSRPYDSVWGLSLNAANDFVRGTSACVLQRTRAAQHISFPANVRHRTTVTLGSWFLDLGSRGPRRCHRMAQSFLAMLGSLGRSTMATSDLGTRRLPRRNSFDSPAPVNNLEHGMTFFGHCSPSGTALWHFVTSRDLTRASSRLYICLAGSARAGASTAQT